MARMIKISIDDYGRLEAWSDETGEPIELTWEDEKALRKLYKDFKGGDIEEKDFQARWSEIEDSYETED